MNYGQQIAKVEAKRTGLMDAAGRAEDEMTRHESTCAQLDEAISILQAVGKEVQAIVHKRLADVVSRCLAAVFDDPYQIDIEFSAKRNRTEASITFVRDGQAVNPMTASGGGCGGRGSLCPPYCCHLPAVSSPSTVGGVG
jgi:hypothetical protein